MNKLEKKICIVTGGTGLIGQEIVNDFLRNGATVIFTFNKNISKAKKFHKNRKNLFY
jgi:NAD(P)-dependent dehydrogenase (short-subunit alcohol dehydrogenase family)